MQNLTIINRGTINIDTVALAEIKNTTLINEGTINVSSSKTYPETETYTDKLLSFEEEVYEEEVTASGLFLANAANNFGQIIRPKFLETQISASQSTSEHIVAFQLDLETSKIISTLLDNIDIKIKVFKKVREDVELLVEKKLLDELRDSHIQFLVEARY